MNGMPKMKVQQHINMNNVVNEFSAEFSKTSINELFCKLCKCIVSCSKTFFLDTHSQTALSETKRQPNFPTGFCCQSHQSVLIR